jgi:YHS domain-containing protein
MKQRIICASLIIVLCSACWESTTTVHQQPAHMKPAAEKKFKDVQFSSKTDFICGMPVSAGVSDTTHYKKGVYGFCSPECKAEFDKNPAAYTATGK